MAKHKERKASCQINWSEMPKEILSLGKLPDKEKSALILILGYGILVFASGYCSNPSRFTVFQSCQFTEMPQFIFGDLKYKCST